MLGLTKGKSTNSREVCKSKVEEQAKHNDTCKTLQPGKNWVSISGDVFYLIATQRLFFLEFAQELFVTL